MDDGVASCWRRKDIGSLTNVRSSIPTSAVSWSLGTRDGRDWETSGGGGAVVVVAGRFIIS